MRPLCDPADRQGRFICHEGKCRFSSTYPDESQALYQIFSVLCAHVAKSVSLRLDSTLQLLHDTAIYAIIPHMSKIPVLVWLPAAFVIGGLVGYYGPSEELRSRELREQEEKAKPRSNNAFGSFAQMVNIPDAAKRPRRARSSDRPAMQDKNHDEESEYTSTNASVQSVEHERHNHRRLAPEDLRARIDEAADLWRTRVEIARSAAAEKLGLAEEKAQSFNDAVDAMNDKLRESMQLVADEIAAAKKMTPELGIRLMGDLSTSLAETYDAIGACVGEELREEVSNLQLVDFVDPSIAEPLIAVQDKIDPQSFKGPR